MHWKHATQKKRNPPIFYFSPFILSGERKIVPSCAFSCIPLLADMIGNNEHVSHINMYPQRDSMFTFHVAI